jgi:hypothetical protein
VPATYIEGVDVVELASAISALDGSNNQSYQAVGAYVCLEGSSNCGAALDRYQLMSGDEAVRAAIASVSGGVEFLTRLESGESVTPQEVFEYFPPVAQERVFQESLAREVMATSRQFDPTTGAPFTGPRLVERVAQKHYGGTASRVDGDYAPVEDGHSLHSYGEGVVRLYQQRRGNNLAGEFSREKMTEISHVLLKVFLSFGLVKVPSLWLFEQKRRKYRFLLFLTAVLAVVISWVF